MVQQQLHFSDILSLRALENWDKMTEELPNSLQYCSRGFGLWHKWLQASDRIKLDINSRFRSVCRYISIWSTSQFLGKNPEFVLIVFYTVKGIFNLLFFYTSVKETEELKFFSLFLFVCLFVLRREIQRNTKRCSHPPSNMSSNHFKWLRFGFRSLELNRSSWIIADNHYLQDMKKSDQFLQLSWTHFTLLLKP